jgi:hypothetical protein
VTSFSILSNNLISWSVQISLVAALGAALPLLFRIRHPKTQLAFLHFVLAICILLPFVEPWQHPLLVANGTAGHVPHSEYGTLWLQYLSWIIGAGILVKLCWLAGGLSQIRRYRSSATRIFPIPESIRQARILTRTDARFGISRCVDGPATLGYTDPIILLPESFQTLDHDAQLSIVCHELIHVRRNDWLVTLFEAIIGCVFWFSPAMWLLLSQIKLTREQLVDAEVVALTAAPEPYVQALLAMSGAQGKLKTIPASFFLSDGHLPRRVRSLLTKRRGSIGRLAVSYGLIACLLSVFTIGVTVWFPLIGEAYSMKTAAQHNILRPALIARTNPTVVPKSLVPTFNVQVPVDRAVPEDVVYSFSEVNSDTAEGEMTFLSHVPPPAPPLLRLLRIPGQPAVRLFRPGELATPEDIARIQSALGDSAVIEVMQSGDGTVQKVTIQRRRSTDEISGGVFGFGIGPDGGFTTGAAGTVVAGDIVH